MNKASSAKKSRTVQVIIGWLAIVLGSWLMIGSFIAIIGFAMNGAPPNDLQEDMRDRFWVFAYLARHYLVTAVIQFIVAGCILGSGIGVLHSKWWARQLLIGTSMLLVVFLLVISLQFVFGPRDSIAFFGFAATFISTAPFLLLVGILRKIRIRED